LIFEKLKRSYWLLASDHFVLWRRIFREIGERQSRRQDRSAPTQRRGRLSYRCAPVSSRRPIDDQNYAASFEHLWTNPDKYTRKPEAHDVIIYGPKDWI
jgi:hypothetical protein